MFMDQGYLVLGCEGTSMIRQGTLASTNPHGNVLPLKKIRQACINTLIGIIVFT
jgi:hypothetical protein